MTCPNCQNEEVISKKAAYDLMKQAIDGVALSYALENEQDESFKGIIRTLVTSGIDRDMIEDQNQVYIAVNLDMINLVRSKLGIEEWKG